MIAKVEIGSECGYLFREVEGDNVCFVPERFVVLAAGTPAGIDCAGYIRSGWSLRNRRWTDLSGLGGHALPDLEKPIDLDTEPEAIRPSLERFAQILRTQAPS